MTPRALDPGLGYLRTAGESVEMIDKSVSNLKIEAV
jgi:hypothetical protein